MQMVEQCYVQQFDFQTVLCLIVQWLDSDVSNSPMVGQCCVQQSDGMTVLCLTVHWLDSADPMVRLYDSAVSSCLMV